MDAMVKFLPEIRIIRLICCQSLDILPWDNNCSRVISIFGTSRSFSSRSCAQASVVQSNVQQVISTTSPRQAAFAQVFFPQQKKLNENPMSDV